jgi:DNA polymerase I-like protein with 3'-5' exonuclease and polymerase domains
MYLNSNEGGSRWSRLKTFRTYAVQCATDDRPTKETTVKCRSYLELDIARVKPTVVVAFGASAMRALLVGTKSKFDDLRGTFTKTAIKEPATSFYVYVTYSPKAVLGQPGLYDDLVRDLRKVFLFAEGRLDQQRHSEDFLRQQYVFPRTVQEVRDICRYIIDYANPGEPPSRHLIAYDTETSTLEPHDPTAKIICVSFSWAALKAATIVLDHPKSWWTPEERELVAGYIKEVLACAKPKALHHEKFDRQMTVHRYGWPLENVVWDTMSGEHLIEEDKRGQYGLKVLTRVRLPAYAGYDGKIDDMRAAHGGLTRAQTGKKFRKDTAKYEAACIEFALRTEEYEKAFTVYRRGLDKWTAKREQEKARAAQARKDGETAKSLRRMRPEVIGKKPKKPLKPKHPVEPIRQEPFDFTMIPLEDLELYAGVDADVTRQHVLHQNQRLDYEYRHDIKIRERVRGADPPPGPVKRLMGRHVLPTSVSFSSMEFTGFPVDLKYLEELDGKLKEVVEKTEQELYELAGEKFVLGNPKEITEVMFNRGFYDENGNKVIVPITDDVARTTKGQIKADEKALLFVANTYGYAFPKKVITFRKATKARSPFLTNVREHAVLDGCMHSSLHLSGTATGRSSSSQENMQNVPKMLAGFNIKKIFVPPPGHTLIDTDAKGAEVRIFAGYSGDKKLIQAINDGMDAHSFFTSEVFGYAYEEVEHMRQVADDLYAKKIKGVPFDVELLKKANAIVKKRTNCKRVVFGTLYGAAAPKIAETAGISIQEAKNVIALMFDMFPSIPKYIHQTENEVRLFKGVYTFTGRKRRFPMADMRMFSNRCFRQAVNFKIQGTSSDIVLWVLNQIHPVVLRDLKGKFHATVHDSIVFSVPHSYTSQVKDLMYEYGTVRVRKEFPWLPVEFLWDVDAGLNYGECTSIDKYLKGQQHDRSAEEEDEEILTDAEVREGFELALG